MKSTFQDKVVVVTGASSGIGRAVCLELAKAGAKLVLAARRKEALEELAAELPPGKAMPCPTDVTKTEDAANLIEKTLKQYGQIDYLFSFAGVLRTGGFGGLSEESIVQMMDINFMGTARCIRAVVPPMQQQGRGHIVTISSLGGKYPFPGSSGYSASKYAVAGLSNALRQELKHDGICVTTVYPSYVGTSMLSTHLESIKRSFFYRLTSDYLPEQAARAIIRATGKRKRELVIPPMAGLTVVLYNLFPGLAEILIGKLSGGWPRYDEPDTF